MKKRGCLLCIAPLLVAAHAYGQVKEPFEVLELASGGERTVAAELVDVDGDGRDDVLRVSFAGVPPDESRSIQVYLQSMDGSVPDTPSFRVALPPGASAYDLGDLLPAPGIELVLLHADGVELLSLASPDAPRRRLRIEQAATFGAAEAEDGLERHRMVYAEFAAQPWILVPLLREVVALDAEGSEHARLEVGARASLYAPERSGPIVMGSGLQLFLRSPRLAIGDVDGDGRVDIVALGRHDIRVFLRREDGQFPGAPDRLIFPRRVSARDHVRGAGEVRGDARDLDADGRLDLMISHASGNLSDARTRIDFYLNRGGVWRLDEPDVTFSSESRWSMEQLLDVDGDARPELVRVGIPVSILELAEMLLTRAVDAYVSVHRAGADGRFASEPWIERKLGVPVAFERGQTRGFMPTLSLDLDGDGRRDLLTSGGGDALEVHRLREDGRFARALRSPMSTAGRLRAGDIDADGRVDLLLFDPRDPDAPVRVVRNRGLQAEDRAQ